MLRAKCLALIAVTLLGCNGPSEDAETGQPDVLMLLIDTLRADRLGSYGYERDTSPNLDAIAERGVVFSKASCQAPWTIPSMASMMTGRYQTSHQERPSTHAATMAELFQGAGYQTIGAVANFVILPNVGFERGFDAFYTRDYRDEDGRRRKRTDGNFTDVVDWVRDELVERTSEPDRAPIFFYLHVVDPHDPYAQHPDLNDQLPFSTTPAIEPAGWFDETLAAKGMAAPEDDPGWKKEKNRILRDRTCYDREVLATDLAFGKLLEDLKAMGVDDPLVAVVSDHGEELWEHLAPMPEEAQKMRGPRQLFFQTHGYLMSEQALRTPFLLSGPGVPKGVVVDAPVENIDLMPTLMELCNIGMKFEPQGQSLVPWMKGERKSSELRDATFAYVQHTMMVREETTGLKLILPTPHGLKLGLEPSLFDLRADPLERHDLYEERIEDVQRLTALATEYLSTYPAENETVDGDAAAQLREALAAMGYGDALIDGEEKDDEEED